MSVVDIADQPLEFTLGHDEIHAILAEHFRTKERKRLMSFSMIAPGIVVQVEPFALNVTPTEPNEHKAEAAITSLLRWYTVQELSLLSPSIICQLAEKKGLEWNEEHDGWFPF